MQAGKKQAARDTRSRGQTRAKKLHFANSCFGMCRRVADFLSSHTQILLQLFWPCAVNQSDAQAAQEQAISILGWQTSLKEGSGTGDLSRRAALLSAGSDTKPRPCLPAAILVLIRTNGINPILQPNLNIHFSPLGSP